MFVKFTPLLSRYLQQNENQPVDPNRVRQTSLISLEVCLTRTPAVRCLQHKWEYLAAFLRVISKWGSWKEESKLTTTMKINQTFGHMTYEIHDSVKCRRECSLIFWWVRNKPQMVGMHVTNVNDIRPAESLHGVRRGFV